MELHVDEVGSPMGTLVLVVRDDALCALDFDDCRERMDALLRSRYGAVDLKPRPDPNGFSSCVRAYLDGGLDALDRIPVETGGTPFQQRVWSALREIRPGKTLTYGQLAESVGRPSAARAVGTTNARNPVALVLPCHRVVGADGSLTGYAGGIHRKRWLLHHEGAVLRP
jgi:methylated-DNA-[protein]-cysteine S-methyltransferase